MPIRPEGTMVIEDSVKPSILLLFYSYTRKHASKLALEFYGLPIAMLPLVLAFFYPLTGLADWVFALIWGAVVVFLYPLILGLGTKKDKRTLPIHPDKLSTQIGRWSGDVAWDKVDSQAMSTFA